MKTLKCVTFAISCWHRSKKCGMMRYPDRCQGKSPCAVGGHVQNLQPWFQQLLIIFDIYSTKTVQRHEMCPFEPTQAQPQSQKGLDKTQTKNRIWWSEQQKTGRVVVCSWITCLERATVSAGSLVTANRNMVVSFTSMLGRDSPLFETHDYIKDITARAQEEFVRLLSLNTVC